MPQGKPPTGRLRIAAALQYRNYRLFFAGQIVSLVGTWMQRLAMQWLVFRLAGGDRNLAHTAQMLGLQGFLGQIPMFAIPPFAGVLIDRLDKQRVLVWTQSAAMTHAFVVAALVLTGRCELWHVQVLAVCLGTIHAFDMPTRQSFVIQMIERKEDLPNAIALNSFMVNCGKLVGPMIAAAVIALVGEGVCFLINGCSFLGVIFAIRAMRVKPHQAPVGRLKPLDDLRQGLQYVFHSGAIRPIILLLILVSMVGVPYTDLLPIVASQVLKGGAGTLGFLRAATGVGAIIGGLWLAHRNSAAGLARVVPIATATFGAGLVAFSFTTSLLPALVLLVVTGLGFMVQMASSNTIVQSVVDDDKRGRVMSLYAVAMQGSLPWGSLLAGYAAAHFGVPRTLLVGGLLCLAGALAFAASLHRWGPTHDRLVQRPSSLSEPDLPRC